MPKIPKNSNKHKKTATLLITISFLTPFALTILNIVKKYNEQSETTEHDLLQYDCRLRQWWTEIWVEIAVYRSLGNNNSRHPDVFFTDRVNLYNSRSKERCHLFLTDPHYWSNHDVVNTRTGNYNVTNLIYPGNYLPCQIDRNADHVVGSTWSVDGDICHSTFTPTTTARYLLWVTGPWRRKDVVADIVHGVRHGSCNNVYVVNA